MIHAIHTHSAPATVKLFGWGELDPPYMARLPSLIACAAIGAVRDLKEAVVSFSRVPAEHLAYNRDLEERPRFEDAARDEWYPNKPNETDRDAYVLRLERDGRTAGFISSFACHPVVCCEQTYSLHGDFVGVATNLIQSEFPGSVGLFLQGSHGDLNAAICHQPQDLSMLGLNIMANRYARIIRDGLRRASPIEATPIDSILEHVSLPPADLNREKLLSDVAAYREKVRSDPDGDASADHRMNTVFLLGAQQILADLDHRQARQTIVEIQAFRLGDLIILGTPFELYRDIKKQICGSAFGHTLMVLSTTNDYAGYAVSRARFDTARYASLIVPLIMGRSPYSQDLEDTIVSSAGHVIREFRG
jgi:hypothetical protein